MTRVVSGAVLVVIVVVTVWWAPLWLFALVGALVTVVAVREVIQLARAGGLAVPPLPVIVASVVVFSAMLPSRESTAVPLDAMLMTASIALGLVVLGAWDGGNGLASISAALFPILYVALPIGALVAIRVIEGPSVLFLLMLTVMVSDTAQYYAGRLFGRHALAPAVSPHKTIEGAIGGLVAGAALFVIVGARWEPAVSPIERLGIGVAIVVAGIAGDLFESMLKRGVQVKDSASLIPGHGGILDRIDALLFAVPVYYFFLRLR